MNLVRLHLRGVERHAVHEEWYECCVERVREIGVHIREPVGVALAVVWRHRHAGDDDPCPGGFRQLDHLRHVAADHHDWRTAQAVVATEFDEDYLGPMYVECPRQAAQAATGGVAADAGIDDGVSVTFCGQPLLQERDPGFARIEAETGAEAVADD